MGADSAYVFWCDDPADTTYSETSLWVSALDLSPDESTLLVGTLTAGWGGPLGGTNWVFEMEDLTFPVDLVGNWHDWEDTGEGVTDGPRGAAWDADGNIYLADFYSNGIFHYAYSADDDDMEDMDSDEIQSSEDTENTDDKLDDKVSDDYEESEDNGEDKKDTDIKRGFNPEAQEGGVIAIIQDGDQITIDAQKNTINVNISDKELEVRKAKWTKPPYKFEQGVLYKYIKSVATASEGCVTDS